MKAIQVTRLSTSEVGLYRNNLKRVCELLGLSYNYLKRFKFPFTYKGMTFEKIDII